MTKIDSPIEFLTLVQGYSEKIESSLKQYDGTSDYDIAAIVWKMVSDIRRFVIEDLKKRYDIDCDVRLSFSSDNSSEVLGNYILNGTFEIATPFSNFREIRLKFLIAITNHHPNSSRRSFEISDGFSDKQRPTMPAKEWAERSNSAF